jgi:hypothetical protein
VIVERHRDIMGEQRRLAWLAKPPARTAFEPGANRKSTSLCYTYIFVSLKS